METNTVVAMGSQGERAFERVKPLLDVLRTDIRKAAEKVAKEYHKLPKLEKAVFSEKVRAEYGWSQSRLAVFAQIGRDFPDRQKAISRSAPTSKIDNIHIETMREIVATPKETLCAAAKAGMFDKPVTSSQIRILRKTGRIPEPEKETPPKTDLQQIRDWMIDTEGHINKASLGIGKITALMEDAGIHDAKGREATILIRSFETLCTKMATANPETSKRAFAILRGEV